MKRCICAAALLALAVCFMHGAFAGTAIAEDTKQDNAAETTGETETSGTAGELQQVREAIDKVPAWAGGVLIVMCLSSLFWGWRMLRMTYALVLGLAFAMTAGAMGAALTSEPNLIVMIVAGLIFGVIGFVLGWFLTRIMTAIWGAVMLGLVCSVPGWLLGNWLVGVILVPVGFIAGLILGWKIALYLDALTTSLWSSAVIAVGAAICAKGLGHGMMLGIMIATFVIAVCAGIFVQFRAIARSGRKDRRPARPSPRRPRRPRKTSAEPEPEAEDEQTLDAEPVPEAEEESEPEPEVAPEPEPEGEPEQKQADSEEEEEIVELTDEDAEAPSSDKEPGSE